MGRLPQPNENARSVAALATVIIDSIPWIGPAIKVYVQRQLQDAQRLLVAEIKKNAIDALDELTDAQREFFIPAGYCFFEQARLGEYEFNLRVLARLIANELTDDEQADVGRVARTARRLEMMSQKNLRCLALIASGLRSINEESETPEASFISPEKINESSRPIEMNVSEIIQAFYDLEWRGILTRREGNVFADSPEHINYRFTAAYFEIVEAVSELC